MGSSQSSKEIESSQETKQTTNSSKLFKTLQVQADDILLLHVPIRSKETILFAVWAYLQGFSPEDFPVRKGHEMCQSRSPNEVPLQVADQGPNSAGRQQGVQEICCVEGNLKRTVWLGPDSFEARRMPSTAS